MEDDSEARAPAVVAILVTRDPGPWFEETLAALAAQDYAEMSVLVMVSGGGEDPTDRVAPILPDAFVRRLPDDLGYGAVVDDALGMVEGAAFFLLCHDDCAPDPDALHVLVEESYRSNAGVVCPKMVRWDDPSVLLHVGMNADKTGAVVERVQAGEIDAGQHDGVRDVFVAPGGFTLVRADLMAELGGFDRGIVAMGEDLDLSWRAQIAGARVMVVPDARVRHLEAVASGLRRPAPSPGGGGRSERGRRARAPQGPSLQELQRRHELRTVLKCYGWVHLLRVLPQLVALALGELAVALVAGDRSRARALAGAWRWNLRNRGELRRLRAQVRAQRVFPDGEVRRLQLRRSARLSTYTSRLAHQGFDVAHGRMPSTAEGASGEDPGAWGDAGAVLTGSVGSAFSEDADFDELDDLGHRSGRDRLGRRRRRQPLASRRSRLVVWVLAAVVLLLGTRDLLSGGLPLVGQLAPFPTWTGAWHQLLAGWQPAGVGTTAPSTPAFGVLGVLGTALLGGMGLLQKVLVLGCIPIGSWGVSRLLSPLCSGRGRLIGAITYLALALPYDALAEGRWDGLIAYAAVPWILSRLARAGGLLTRAEVAPSGGAPSEGAPAAAVAPAWRATPAGQVVVLGVVEAVAVSFAPAVAVVVILCAAGVVLGSVLVGEPRGTLRVLAAAAGSTLVAAVLCAPWVVGVVLAGRDAVSIFGLVGSSGSVPGWTALLRFDVGPTGGGPLSWLLIASALLPLLIGRQRRLAWAARFWALACCSWVLALVVVRGWTAPFSPSLDVILAPAAVGVAAAVGLGVAAFENDLAGYRFGWRQLVTAVGVVAGVVGLLPVVAAAGGGRWGLAVTGYAQPLSFMPATGSAANAGRSATGPASGGASGTSAVGAYRVLWLGDPRALPLGAWSIAPGLAYATSEDGTPGAADLWAPAAPGPAATLARAVELVTAGRTSELGRLLAPASVRYVVVVSSLAPQIPGNQTSADYPPPPDLVPALSDQDDLTQVSSSGGGYSVFENTAYLPERAERSGGPVGAAPGATAGGSGPGPGLAGWRPVLGGTTGSASYAGTVTSGTVFASYAPGGLVRLSVDGHGVRARSAFGWAAQFPGTPAGEASLGIDSPGAVTLGIVAELLLWLVVAAALLGRRRWLDWWWGPLLARGNRGGRGRRGRSGRSGRRGTLRGRSAVDRTDPTIPAPIEVGGEPAADPPQAPAPDGIAGS